MVKKEPTAHKLMFIKLYLLNYYKQTNSKIKKTSSSITYSTHSRYRLLTIITLLPNFMY